MTAQFYREACKDYLAAWKIAPQFPEPATELLQHSRAGFVEGTPREWFDRVMLAEIDHPMAFTYYRTHLRGEGTDALIAFGEECATTKRYDTKVPFELLECLWAVENHTGENVWEREGMYEKVRDLCQAALKAPKYLGKEQDENSRAWLNATQIVIAGRANRLEEIPALWDMTNTATLTHLARVYNLRTPLPSLKAAAMAAANEPTRLVNVVESSLIAARDKETLEQAARQIETAAGTLEPDDPRAAQWRATLALYQGFYTGESGKLTFPPDFCKLAGTENWTREDEQTLVARGCEELPLEPLIRLPFPLELSMEISIIALPKGVPMAGVQIGPRQSVPNQGGKGNFFGINSENQEAGMYHYALATEPTGPQKETNELRIRVWQGHREIFVNGQRMFSSSAFDFRPDGYVALWVPGGADLKPQVRFSNISVRRLDFASPPHRKTPLDRITYYTERIKAEPDHLNHRADRGDAHLTVGQFAEAIADYEALLKKEPTSHRNIYHKGRAHEGTGEYPEAIAQYQKLLEMPDVVQRQTTRIKYDKDGKNIPQKVEVSLYHMRANNRLAWLKATCPDEAIRDGEKAVEHARQAVVLSKDQYRECYLTAVAAFAETGDFETAARVLKKVGKLTGKSEQVLIAPIAAAITSKRPFRHGAK